ncbi:hypothetical protein [Dysgonomonas sp. 511]|uniref:hypothetical protein n=1 Tax=Dysgonomonas sp. 511 TaxID=2302930 RepID=UPI0013D32250|nr:hypothetical protein [Dysgonomonas sp. 511]NDV79495.1 hypothetical protein [Dysgonomonas sp. 511]
MNKNIFIISLLLIASTFISCGSDDDGDIPTPELPTPSTFQGTWYTTQRTIKTNYPELDERLNNLFGYNIKTNTLKRVIKPHSTMPGVGTIVVTSTNKETGIGWERIDSYEEGPGEGILTVNDQRLGYPAYAYSFGPGTMTSTLDISYSWIVIMAEEVGYAGPTPVAMEGVLTIVETPNKP